jgi:hypothetical protein
VQEGFADGGRPGGGFGHHLQCLRPSAVVQVGAFNHKRRVSAVPIEAARVEDRMGDGNTEVAATLEHTGGFDNRAGHVVGVHQRVVDDDQMERGVVEGRRGRVCVQMGFRRGL